MRLHPMTSYSFRPITPADETMFKGWLSHPHIGDWWGDGDTEWTLIAEEFDTDAVTMSIVETNGQPFAYVQDYNAHHWPMPQYADQPDDARALDTFLGDPAFLGQGHGAGYLAQRLAQLRRRYSTILTDPDPANTRAIAAYTRAGFRPLTVTPCEDGDLVQVMIHT